MKHNVFVDNDRQLVSKVLTSANLKQSIMRALELIGGIEKLVEKGDTLLLKPNYNTADPYPGSSDPNFIGAVIEVLREAGAEKIIVGERTAFLHNRKVLEKAGIIEVVRKAGAEVTVFGRDGWQTLLDRTGWRRVRVEGGKFLHSVSLARQALEAQKIIYVPLIKTHHAAQFTGSIKLSMGLVKPFFDQSRFHARYLQEKLAELGLIIKPDLIIMDARKVFIKGGPAKGELRTPNLILSSGNQVAIDVEGIKILQSYPGNALEDRSVWDLTQIRHAVELGLGPSKEEEYDVKTG